MGKDVTEIVFILDRSGSMSGLEADTIGGFNSMMEKQKKEAGEALVSTVLFDDQVEVLHNRKDLMEITPITEKEYYVRGCTALLDAVGRSIRYIGKLHKAMPEGERPEKTLFIITTDGMENASKEYSYDKVKKMVEKKRKKHHWEFLFLGANIDAVQVAGRFGVAANRAARFENDAMGAELNYQVMSGLVSCARSAGSAMAMLDAFEEDDMISDIESDYEEFQEALKSTEKEASISGAERDAIRKMMPDLSDREKNVAKIVFGLDGNTQVSYEKAEKILGISIGRIRQISSRLRRKAAKYMES